MARLNDNFAKVTADARSKAMYRRMVACWAVDLLSSRLPVTWPDHQTAPQLHDDQGWQRLYGDSVLDD